MKYLFRVLFFLNIKRRLSDYFVCNNIIVNHESLTEPYLNDDHSFHLLFYLVTK